MELLTLVWNNLIKKPLATLMVLLSAYTHSLGWSVVLLSGIVQILFIPLTLKRYKTMQKIADVYPELKKLYKKYRNDPIRLKQAQKELYRKNGIKPSTNWLLVLVSIPILIALYRIIFDISKNGIITLSDLVYSPIATVIDIKNLNLDTTFWGSDLLSSPHLLMLVLLFVASIVSSFTTYMFYNYLPKEETINQLKEQFTKNTKEQEMSEKDLETLAKTLYYTRYFQFIVGAAVTTLVLAKFPALITLYVITFNLAQATQNLILYFITKGGVTLPSSEQA